MPSETVWSWLVEVISVVAMSHETPADQAVFRSASAPPCEDGECQRHDRAGEEHRPEHLVGGVDDRAGDHDAAEDHARDEPPCRPLEPADPLLESRRVHGDRAI